MRTCRTVSDYLKERQPEFRHPTMRKVNDKIRGLKAAPHIGRPGRVEGTREILFPPLPYIAVYHVNAQSIEIWRIYHAAQDQL